MTDEQEVEVVILEGEALKKFKEMVGVGNPDQKFFLADLSLRKNDPSTPICIGCGKSPEDIEEYTMYAREEEMTNTEFVIEEEGTYNSSNGHFTCDECYLRMGSPSIPGLGWKAP